MQEASGPVAAALIRRMNTMSKMHVASVLVSLLFGNQAQQGDLDSAHRQPKPPQFSPLHSPSGTNDVASSSIPENLSMLAVVVQKMLPVLQQMGLVDRTTLPCSLAHVLLNRGVTTEQQSVAVSLLSVLNCSQDITSSIGATLRHAQNDGLEHLQRSTITALEAMCSGITSGALCTVCLELHCVWCLQVVSELGTRGQTKHSWTTAPQYTEQFRFL